MATIDNPAPNPRPMTVAERQGTAKVESTQYPLPVLRALQAVWAIWLVACILVFLPYLPGVFGGMSFLFAALGSMVFGGLSGIFSGVARLTLDNFLLVPWLGLSPETEQFILDGWLSPVIIIVGALLINLLWRASRRVPLVLRILLRAVALFVGFIVGLETLMLLSYPLGIINRLFTWQEKWYSIPITIVGAALVYLLWKWIDTIPHALHGIGRFLTSLLAAIVALEFLVVLSYPLDWLREGATNLLLNLDPSLVTNSLGSDSFLRSWWLTTLVLIVGGFLVWLLWKPARPLAGVALAGLLLWAHMFGWERSQILPQVLVEKAPKTQQILSDLLQPDIVSRDDQVLELQVSAIVGSETPPPNPRPITREAELRSSLDSRRPHEAGEAPILPKDESEEFHLKVTISTNIVKPGDVITVTGSGFRPNTPGLIRWQSVGTSASVEELGQFKPDNKGDFVAAVPVPNDPERVINLSNTPNTIAFTQRWPSGDLYFTETFGLVGNAIIETIFLALMGTTLGVILSIPLSFMASQNLMSHNVVSKSVYVVTRTILNILRSVEVVIWAIIFVAAVGIGPFAGMLALAVHSIASLGKLYSEAIEAIDPGPIEAITATGANRLQVIRYAVIPQFIPQFVSFTLYRWDINVRMSTIIGIVGGGGVGLLLIQYIGVLAWHQAGTAILFIAIIVIIMDYASSKIRAAVV